MVRGWGIGIKSSQGLEIIISFSRDHIISVLSCLRSNIQIHFIRFFLKSVVHVIQNVNSWPKCLEFQIFPLFTSYPDVGYAPFPLLQFPATPYLQFKKPCIKISFETVIIAFLSKYMVNHCLLFPSYHSGRSSPSSLFIKSVMVRGIIRRIETTTIDRPVIRALL